MTAIAIGAVVVFSIFWLLYRAAQSAEKLDGDKDGGEAFGGWSDGSDGGGGDGGD